MDTNRLYFEHQIALLRVTAATDRTSKTAYQAVADAVARRILRGQLAFGAPASNDWFGQFRKGC